MKLDRHFRNICIGAFMLMALLIALGGLVIVVVTYGFDLHVASFMVAGGLAVIGLVLLLYGRARMSVGRLAPTRSLVIVPVRLVRQRLLLLGIVVRLEGRQALVPRLSPRVRVHCPHGLAHHHGARAAALRRICLLHLPAAG